MGRFWFLGLEFLFEGEKGERLKINGSPSVSTQPIFDGFFVFPSKFKVL
jgi:hypothetical protein